MRSPIVAAGLLPLILAWSAPPASGPLLPVSTPRVATDLAKCPPRAPRAGDAGGFAYLLDGELVHAGEKMSDGSLTPEEVGLPTSSDAIARMSLLCWKEVEYLFGVEVWHAGLSVWTADPLAGATERLVEFRRALAVSFAQAGEYALAITPPEGDPEVTWTFDVQPDRYVISVTHDRIGDLLFISSQHELAPAGAREGWGIRDEPDGIRVVKKSVPGMVRWWQDHR